MMDLYSEEILDHYKNSPYRGSLQNPTYVAKSKNVSCGDELVVYMRVEAQKIVDARFEGRGCAISQATCSMVLESLVGQQFDAIGTFAKDDILALVGIDLGLNRQKCAFLVLDALRKIYECKES
jgi:nitrogen fixation NifU-like protein